MIKAIFLQLEKKWGKDQEPADTEDGRGILRCNFPLSSPSVAHEGIENAYRKSFYYFIFTHSVILFLIVTVITVAVLLGTLQFSYDPPSTVIWPLAHPKPTGGQAVAHLALAYLEPPAPNRAIRR